jgi:hypothetical protein
VSKACAKYTFNINIDLDLVSVTAEQEDPSHEILYALGIGLQWGIYPAA